MEVLEMSERRHLSHSQIDMLERCGQQWKFRYIDGIKRPPSVALLVGSAVDSGVNLNLIHKIETGELLPDQAVVEATRDAMHGEWSRGDVELSRDESLQGSKKVLGAAVDQSVRLAGLHHRRVAPTVRPKSVQRRFKVQVPRYDVDLVGVLDIEETDGAVRDTKTAGKTPKPEDAERSSQLTMYALAKLVVDGELPPALTLDYLVKTKTPKVTQLVTTRTRADLVPFLSRIEAAVGVTESGVVTPAPPGAWWCSERWCGYWSICPFVRTTSVFVSRVDRGGGGDSSWTKSLT